MTPTGRLLDEIAACERQVRALQARQLGLLAEYAAAERDGLRPGECEQTERAAGMEAATALGASTASARMLVCDADTLVGLLPAAAAATPSATPRSATSTTDSSTPPADPPHPTTPTPTASAATRQPDTQPDHGGPVPDAHRITWTGPSGRPHHSLAPPALGHGTPTLDQLRHRRRLLEPEGPSG